MMSRQTQTQQHGSNRNGMGQPERLLTPEEAADILRVKPSWLYHHTRRRAQDRIPFVKIGHYVRFREGDLLAYIERRMVKG